MDIKPIILAASSALLPATGAADESSSATMQLTPQGSCSSLTVKGCTAQEKSATITWHKPSTSWTFGYRDFNEGAKNADSTSVDFAANYQSTWNNLTGGISGEGRLSTAAQNTYALEARELSLQRGRTFQLTPDLKTDLLYGGYIGYARARASIAAQSALHITKAQLNVPISAQQTISYEIDNQSASADTLTIAQGQTPYFGATAEARARYAFSDNINFFASLRARLGLDRLESKTSLGTIYNHPASGITAGVEAGHTTIHHNILYEKALDKAEKLSGEINDGLSIVAQEAGYNGTLPLTTRGDVLKTLGIQHNSSSTHIALDLSKTWTVGAGNNLTAFARYSRPVGKNPDPSTTTFGLSLEY